MTVYIYGRHPVFEALRAKRRVFERLLLGKNVQGDIIRRIESLAHNLGIPVERVDREVLEELVGEDAVHQGVVLLCGEKMVPSWREILARVKDRQDALVLFVDRVEDPRNLGAIIRTAAFFGVQGIVVSRARSAPLDSRVVKAAAGGIEVSDVVQVNNFTEIVRAFKEAGCTIVGLEEDGEVVLWDFDPGPFPVGLVVGGENAGIRKIVRSLCDVVVRIPGKEGLPSLNVSVATGIAIAAIVQRRQGHGPQG
ncbi:23S rRNA (guanosine(2251)-2'-O)-methyltransferase RlmB [Candidatus Caldatribacterium sp.]|uniref:23S rRNA (guanosine(2251)-2'-O)-methyltransferase RlmB n=1 Tax=Candidatus Caldatribacterium sp. TaxID=2282143 RepID=UPI0038425D1C|nr:23S rRNA (guanosine(2251)-2'-O)-methyltransferase RlmB [Candidatus Caldatribacterium sp.]